MKEEQDEKKIECSIEKQSGWEKVGHSGDPIYYLREVPEEYWKEPPKKKKIMDILRNIF